MKKLRLFAMLLASACLTGCISSDNDDSFIQNKDNAYYDIGYNVYENGLLYLQSAQIGNELSFLDYESMCCIPLCNKPNCTHTSSDCISKFAFSESQMSFVYQDYIYWFTTDYRVIDKENGQSQDVEILTKCMRAMISTGEVETFIEIEGVFMNHAIDLAIANDRLYIIGSREMYQDEDGTWRGVSRSREQYLYSINLKTADVVMHSHINDSPHAENNWIHGGSVFSEVEIDGIYNGKLYMHYQYVEDPQVMIDIVNSMEPADFNEIPWKYENKCFDIETGEITISELPYAWWISDNTYIYQKNGVFYVMDEFGKSVAAPNITDDGIFNITYVNGIIWKCTGGGGFDPETEDEIIIADKYVNGDGKVMDYVNGNYVIQYYDENYNLCFDFVAEEELLGE